MAVYAEMATYRILGCLRAGGNVKVPVFIYSQSLGSQARDLLGSVLFGTESLLSLGDDSTMLQGVLRPVHTAHSMRIQSGLMRIGLRSHCQGVNAH